MFHNGWRDSPNTNLADLMFCFVDHQNNLSYP